MTLLRDGWAALGLSIAIAVVAALGGQNLLVLTACVGFALVAVAGPVGRWNLRNLEVVRQLPAGIHAGTGACGYLIVRNRRRWGAAVSIWVEDQAGAVADAVVVPAGGEVRLPVAWRFPRRGAGRLGRLRLRSAFPFGFFAHTCTVGRPVEVVVWPALRAGVAWARPGEAEAGAAAGHGPGGAGDFVGLRGWRPGDTMRAVHWRTTARVGTPIVVERTRDAATEREVVVPDVRGALWEQAIARAAGAIDEGLRGGRRVWLALPADLADHAPRRAVEGEVGRRQLLDVLALLPARDGTS